MQLRDIWGSRDLFHYEYPDGGLSAPPAPGTGETAVGAPDSTSAGTENADQSGNTPQNIPYTRFKEVNDARRQAEDQLVQYEALSAAGYGPQDLQRLATWESEYGQDPVGTWIRQAQEIDQLPPQVKAAVADYLANGTQGTPGADGVPPVTARQVDQLGELDELDDGEPPDWAKPLLQKHEVEEAEERQQQISEFYDGLEGVWRDLDVQQGVVYAEGHEKAGTSTTPPEAIHAFMTAYSPTAADAASLLRDAREAWLAVRQEVIESVMPPRPGSTAPRSVPGGGGSAPAPPIRPKTLAEARKLAAADPRFQS